MTQAALGAPLDSAEDSLLARCQRGEGGAWRELYRENVDRLWRFARRLGVHPGEVEDVVQETFIVAHRRLAEFDGGVPITTWLYAIALRTAKGSRRRAWRRQLARFVGWEPEVGDEPDREVARTDAEAEVAWILARMPEKKRTVLVLYELEELDGPTIAALLGCPVHTVWSRLRLARGDFKRLLRRRVALQGAESKHDD